MNFTAVPFRKRLLHILLWCLAGAAASGVLTVLVSDRDVLWRVTAMGFVAAAAVGLMIPCSILADRERSRAAGHFGITLCIIQFLLSIVFIWSGLWPWRLEERIGWTILLIGLMAVPCIGFLWMASNRATRAAGIVGLAFAAISSACYMLAIWFESSVFLNYRSGETGHAFAAAGLFASLSLIGLGMDSRHWRWIGVGASATMLALALYGIWRMPQGDPAFTVCASTLAALVAFANVLIRASLIGGQRLVIYGTIASAAAIALLLDLQAIIADPGNDTFGFRRLIAGATIVTISGTLAVVVLAMLNRRSLRRADSVAAGTLLSAISLQCPRCGKQQTLALGEGRCSDCRLIIHTRVEVPACGKCGYDLSMIRGENCPECGTPIG
mgnify:CR=1 FL=1